MKIKHLPQTFLFCIALLGIFTACKKDDVDYRDKYIGAYNFSYYYTFTVLGSGATSYDTVLYVGNVALEGDSALLVDWPDSGDQEVLDIDPNGSLFKCRTFLGDVSSCALDIAYDDNVCGPGPNGANYTVKIRGVKQ